MPPPTPDNPTRKNWTGRALRYAETYDWQLVPLQANSEASPAYSDDPVEQQLGCFVLTDYPKEATSDPEEIEELGVQFPVALIGAVTGRESDLFAVEIESPRAAGAALRDRMSDLAPEAPRVLGTRREYVLFRYPEAAELPALTRQSVAGEEAAVLHGEGSVIRLPWRYYQWALRGENMPQRPGEEVLALFGIGETTQAEATQAEAAQAEAAQSGAARAEASGEETAAARNQEEGEPWTEEGDPLEGGPSEGSPSTSEGLGGDVRPPVQNTGSRKQEKGSREAEGQEGSAPADRRGENRPEERRAPRGRGQRPVQLELSLGSGSPNGRSSSPASGSLFRTGEELRPKPGEAPQRLPWTVAGGLSLLTGPSKTAGTSTWAINLAAHVAAGEPFLGEGGAGSEVVMLAGVSPPSFRRQLHRTGLLGRQSRPRLHVLHPGDVRDLRWRSALSRAYERAEEVGARLIIVDCLDRYVRLKQGGCPVGTEEVAHALTAEAPPECAVLAVKSVDCSAEEPLSQTLGRLDLLGRVAAAVLRLDNVATASRPRLRRLLTLSRTEGTPSALYCALRGGRYKRVRVGEAAGGPASAHPAPGHSALGHSAPSPSATAPEELRPRSRPTRLSS